jgi:hypothetical protein
MAVPNAGTKVLYQGNGAAISFPFGFRYLSAEHVSVYRGVGGVGLLASRSSYALTPNAGQVGGTITFYTPPAAGETFTIERLVPLDQPIVINNQDGFHPAVVETGLDRAMMAAQQIDFKIEDFAARAVYATDGPLGPLPSIAARAGKLLAFDAAGRPTVTTFPPAPIFPVFPDIPDLDAALEQITATLATVSGAALVQIAAASAQAQAAADAVAGVQVGVTAAAAQALAAAGVAIPAAQMAAVLAANYAEVIAPVTTTIEAFMSAGASSYDLGDVLPLNAPFRIERLPAVRIDLSRSGGTTIDLGSVA